MRAGRLRHRVIIEEPARIQDPITGEITQGWRAFAVRVPAAIEPLSVRDFFASQSAQSEVSTRIIIRHRKGLTPNMRILHKDKTYYIEGILSDANSGVEYVTLPCRSGVRDES